MLLCGGTLAALIIAPFFLHCLKLQGDLASYCQVLHSRGEKLTIEELGFNPSAAALQAGSNLVAACQSFTNPLIATQCGNTRPRQRGE